MPPDRSRTGSASRVVAGGSRRAWMRVAATLVGLVVLAALGVTVMRGPLAERLWPEAEAEGLRRKAETALRAGRLTAADGSGARELYEAAIAIDPDRAELRTGLARVAQAAVTLARDAVAQADFARAHRHLRLARELDAPRRDIDAVAIRLRDREAAVAGIDLLLRDADAARAAGRLVGDAGAALPLYGRVLDLQPRNVRALEGREDALDELLQRARQDLRAGRHAEGAAAIAAALAFAPGHANLPEAQAELHQANEKLRARIERDLRAGRLDAATAGLDALRAGAATGAGETGDEAGGADDAVLSDRLARAWLTRSRAAAADFEFERTREALAHAQALASVRTRGEVRETRVALARAERAHARRAPMRGPAARREVAGLLARAAEAEARGDWLTPPGESAFDHLRAAHALAPEDPGVRRAMARLSPRLADCFERELRDNRLQRARVCLDARVAFEGGGGAVAAARTRLARRWVEVGVERLARGELAGARAAHDTARMLDAEAEGLSALAERLRAAEATTP